jgi:hypothetical protein
MKNFTCQIGYENLLKLAENAFEQSQTETQVVLMLKYLCLLSRFDSEKFYIVNRV